MSRFQPNAKTHLSISPDLIGFIQQKTNAPSCLCVGESPKIVLAGGEVHTSAHLRKREGGRERENNVTSEPLMHIGRKQKKTDTFYIGRCERMKERVYEAHERPMIISNDACIIARRRENIYVPLFLFTNL